MKNAKLLLKYCSLIASLIILSISGFSQNPEFTYFSGEDGISQVSTLCSIEDSRGFLWFGTIDGLNRYDGYDFTVFKSDPLDEHSIVDNIITALHEDVNGNIWVGTTLGLSKYNYKTNQFISFQHIPKDSTSLTNNYIKEIFEDTITGTLWIGTRDGLNKYVEKENQFQQFFQTSMPNASIEYQKVVDIGQDKNGRIWIGYDKSLCFIENNQLINYQSTPNTISSLKGKEIRYIYLDHQQRFLVAAENGLFLFDEEKEKFKFIYQPEHGFIKSYHSTKKNEVWVGTNEGLIIFSNNGDLKFQNGINYSGKILGSSIETIVEDKNGIIWVGSIRGLAQYNPLICQFNTKRILGATNEETINNNIWSFAEDNEGNIILGGDKGLFKFYPTKQKMTKWILPEAINEMGIMTSLAFKDETLWIGTWDNGLIQYNYKTNKFKIHTKDDSNSSSIGSNQIHCVKYDKQDRLWIGTKKGLFQFLPEQNKFQSFALPYPEGNNSNSILEIFPDESDKFWLATEGGLVHFDINTEDYIVHKHDKNKEQSLSHNFVLSIKKTKDGTIWIATSSGLNKWIPSTNSFQSYGVKEGLPNDVVYGFLEDENRNLWLSTNMGLSKFNPQNDSFTNFDIYDGLQDNEFNLNAAYKSKKGHFYFGGVNGFNYFFPDDIKINSTPPSIYIDRLDVLDRHHQELKQHDISGKEKIQLSFEDYFFSIHFTALNFTNSEKNDYLYKLEGFDSNWKNAGEERIATYTNLKKGDYTFKVKAANNSGVWNEEGAELEIHIIPPFWLTNWFALLMVILAIGTIFAIVRMRTANIKKKNIELEKIVSQRTADVLEQKEQIERKEFLFRSIYEKSSVGIAYSQIINNEINLNQCNQELTKILGYSESELKELTPEDIVLSEDFGRDSKRFSKALSEKKEFLTLKEVKFIHKNGQLVYCKCLLTFQWNNQNKIDYIICIFIDETEEKLARQKLELAEAQLIQSNKMASLGQLTAGIAHEINNPVNFIYSGVNALKKNISVLLNFISKYDDLKTSTDFEKQKLIIENQKKEIDYGLILEDIEGLVESITTGAVRTEEIIKGLQTFSRKDTIKIQSADIHTGLDATLHLLKKEFKENIFLEKKYDPTIGKIDCFPGDLNQVFLNILINAIHSFNDQGGLINIETKNQLDNITIEIKDNGPGIPKEISSRIFDPFFTTKEVGKGTGLGLSISYGIIKKHKGTINVKSKVGVGTSFFISLPKNWSYSPNIHQKADLAN